MTEALFATSTQGQAQGDSLRSSGSRRTVSMLLVSVQCLGKTYEPVCSLKAFINLVYRYNVQFWGKIMIGPSLNYCSCVLRPCGEFLRCCLRPRRGGDARLSWKNVAAGMETYQLGGRDWLCHPYFGTVGILPFCF